MLKSDKSQGLGPLFTLSEDELARPARRREDRDVLVLRIELEAQRREVARLMAIIAGSHPTMLAAPDASAADLPSDRLLLSARDLKKALGVSNGTLYRWVNNGTFPAQIHMGSLARWKKSDIDVWLQGRTEARAHVAVGRERGETVQRVSGGRSRWAATTASTPAITEGHVRSWEPSPTPLRGVGWRLQPGLPEPVSPDHVDYRVPRYRLEDAARYVGLPSYRQWDLYGIPHGRTRAMHYCFAQSDLDEFKATLPPRKTKRPKEE